MGAGERRCRGGGQRAAPAARGARANDVEAGTVAILPAGVIPAWIFCLATMMLLQLKTRRCTVIG